MPAGLEETGMCSPALSEELMMRECSKCFWMTVRSLEFFGFHGDWPASPLVLLGFDAVALQPRGYCKIYQP